MARKTTVVVALLIAAGLIVAMLPAQESARRRVSVYGGATADSADLAPAPEPNLIPVDAAPPARSTDKSVSPAGIFGRARRGDSLSSQLRASSEAAGQEYTPTAAQLQSQPTTQPPASIYEPAEISPPPAAVPMPLDAARPAADATAAAPVELPAAEEPAASAPSAETASEMRSVLKKTRTALPSDSPAPAAVPARQLPPIVMPTRPAGPSSRRTTSSPTSTATGPRTRSTSPAIDTSSITGLAVSGRSPSLRVDVAGPSGINVGKAAPYVVTLVNEGDTPAQEVQLRVALPGFVAVAGSEASSGEAMMHADPSGQQRLLWTVPAIAPRGHETLRLQLTASEGQAFELAIEWAARPAVAKATIAVKQPQLQLSLAGPADMTFGEEKTFTLSVANPGNGDAENVVINLSSGEARRQQVEVGNLPAGQRKEVTVKIVASQAGEMEIHAVAAAEGGLQADAAGKVIVRRAELAIAIEGPELKYAGSEATYAISIQNSGTAAAENVQLSLALPAGAKYLGGIDGATPAAGSLKWKLATLSAGGDRAYEVKLQLNAAGANLVAIDAQGAAGVAASGEVETTVEAAADLKLVVNDPAGPLPTSEFAIYEVQVMNRGSQAARQVKIVMQFGDGIEPVAFDGAEAKLVPGQIVCQPLTELAAGEQVTMRVKARADRGGTHQFRVEVTSDDDQTRLVSEGTTRFFAEAGRTGGTGSTARKPTLVPQGGTFQR